MDSLPASELGDRDWSELPLAVLTSFLAKLSAVDILMGAGLVCQSWLEAAKSPCLWREVDMSGNACYDQEEFLEKDAGVMCTMAKVAIDRSDGRLEAFAGEFFVSDDLLNYIGERSPSLKRLGLISCPDVSNEGFTQLVTRTPLLEDLTVRGCDYIEGEAYVVAARACPQLWRLVVYKLRSCEYSLSDTSSTDTGQGRLPWGIIKSFVKCKDVLGIASMRGLWELTLVHSAITGEQLEAVIDGCPHLEHLRMVDCWKLVVHDALRAKCARIRTLELPAPAHNYSDSDDDSYYIGYAVDSDED